MVCLCKYHNLATNLFCIDFQQLKSLGSAICNPLGRYLQHNVYHFQKDIKSFEDKRHDIRVTKQISVSRISNLPSITFCLHFREKGLRLREWLREGGRG